MNLLTEREALIVTHALQVARDRFRDDAKVVRENYGGIASDAAVARLAAEFDSYVQRCNDLLVKLDKRGQFSAAETIEIDVSRKQLGMLFTALDLLYNAATTDAERADCNMLLDYIGERKA